MDEDATFHNVQPAFQCPWNCFGILSARLEPYGLRAGYLSRWEADLHLTMYGGEANELHDRDFVSATVKYSF